MGRARCLPSAGGIQQTPTRQPTETRSKTNNSRRAPAWSAVGRAGGRGERAPARGRVALGTLCILGRLPSRAGVGQSGDGVSVMQRSGSKSWGLQSGGLDRTHSADRQYPWSRPGVYSRRCGVKQFGFRAWLCHSVEYLSEPPAFLSVKWVDGNA